MTQQSEFLRIVGALACITDYPDTIEYLEFHFSAEEMERLKKDPLYFYMGADQQDQDRIWNAIECRTHKRKQPVAAE